MANEEKKDFNAMLHKDAGMPKVQLVTDEAVIRKYGGTRMYFAPPLAYDALMKSIPYGKLTTVGAIRRIWQRKTTRTLPTPSRRGSSSPLPHGQATSARRTKLPIGARCAPMENSTPNIPAASKRSGKSCRRKGIPSLPKAGRMRAMSCRILRKTSFPWIDARKAPGQSPAGRGYNRPQNK